MEILIELLLERGFMSGVLNKTFLCEKEENNHVIKVNLTPSEKASALDTYIKDGVYCVV